MLIRVLADLTAFSTKEHASSILALLITTELPDERRVQGSDFRRICQFLFQGKDQSRFRVFC